MKTSHDIIWEVIDKIAKKQNITVSRLAINAKLDATSFNISKRQGQKGPHYPSMTTVLAVLKATNMTWKDFANIWEECERA